MIDAIKANPGKYNYASVGSGSPHHLFMEALKTEYGLDIQHVPYKGTPAALTDLLTGNMQVMFSDATIAVPNIQAGKVVGARHVGGEADDACRRRCRRSPRPCPASTGRRGRASSRRRARRRRSSRGLSAELQKIQATPEFQEQLFKFGMEPFPPQTPEQFAAIIAAEQPRWAKAIKDSGAKVD